MYKKRQLVWISIIINYKQLAKESFECDQDS